MFPVCLLNWMLVYCIVLSRFDFVIICCLCVCVCERQSPSGMSRNTWWQRGCHTGSALWSPAGCLRSRPRPPPGLWSWWPPPSACDYRCLWTLHQTSLFQSSPAWWTAPPGPLWHSSKEANKAGEEREGRKTKKQKKECLERTKCWGVYRKCQQGTFFAGYINSLNTHFMCASVRSQRNTSQRIQVKELSTFFVIQIQLKEYKQQTCA